MMSIFQINKNFIPNYKNKSKSVILILIKIKLMIIKASKTFRLMMKKIIIRNLIKRHFKTTLIK